MANKYEVDINVNANTKSSGRFGTGSAATRQTRADIRQSIQQAQEVKKTAAANAARDPQQKNMLQLSRSLHSLDRNIVKLNANIAKLSKDMTTQSRMQRMGGGGIGRGGGGFGRGVGMTGGAGMSKVGAALPFLGAVIGALGFAVSKVLEIGRASLAKTLEQRSTAGVAGLQTSGKYTGVFTAAEFGQYLKERRMAGGEFFEPEKYGNRRRVGTKVTEEGKRKPIYEERETQLERAPLGIRAAAIFGTGAEFAKTAGLMDLFTGGRGEAGVSDVIRSAYQRGRGGKGVRDIGTELPILLREITGKMEDAVKEGVNGSDIAKDMATELVSIARVTPGGQIRSATQIQKSMMGIQDAAAKGQGQGMATWRMNMAAKNLLTNQGVAGQQARMSLAGEGLLSPEQRKRLAAGEQLDPEQMMFLTQSLQAQQSGLVRQAFAKDVVNTLKGEGTRDEKLSRFHRIAQGSMPELNLTPQKSAQMFDMVSRQNAAERYNQMVQKRQALENDLTQETKPSRQKDIKDRINQISQRMKEESVLTRSETGDLQYKSIESIGREMKQASVGDINSMFNRRLNPGKRVRFAQEREGMRESMLFSSAAFKAQETVVTLESSFMSLANNVNDTVAGSISSFNTAIGTMAKGAGAVIEGMETLTSKMKDFAKEVEDAGGFGAYIKDAITPGFMK